MVKYSGKFCNLSGVPSSCFSSKDTELESTKAEVLEVPV